MLSQLFKSHKYVEKSAHAHTSYMQKVVFYFSQQGDENSQDIEDIDQHT